MTGAWQLQKDNTVVLLFANVSDSPFASRLEFDLKQYKLPATSLAVTPIVPDGTKGGLKIQATDQPEVELAPRSVLAWETTSARDN